MKRVFIVGARERLSELSGNLKDTPAVELGIVASRAAIEQAGIDAGRIDEAIMGCILTANQGMGPGRQVSIGAGLPSESCYLVNMLCGSGMRLR